MLITAYDGVKITTVQQCVGNFNFAILDCFYVPHSDINLISVPYLDRHGCSTTFSEGKAQVRLNKVIIAEGELTKAGLYQLKMS